MDTMRALFGSLGHPDPLSSRRTPLAAGAAALGIAIFLAVLVLGATDAPHAAGGEAQSSASELPSRARSVVVRLPDLPVGATPLEMVLIHPGTFTMGSHLAERGRLPDRDWPAHEVAIDRPFYIGKYEVTQAQWEAVMGEGSHRPKYPGKNKPVQKVSWWGCQRFIGRLNELGHGPFRLPSEAEWEYACRAGTSTRFSFGDILECPDTGRVSCEEADMHIWWAGNSEMGASHSVGLKEPNAWGLHDMHGNVAEWCADVWEAPYERGPQTAPTGPELTWLRRWWPLTSFVNRGGSAYFGGGYRGLRECRSASRTHEQGPDYHYSLGFRLVRQAQ